MKEQLSNWWQDQSSEDQVKFKKYGAGAILIAVLFVVYYTSGQDENVIPPPVVEEEITTDANLLEADIRTKVNKDLEYVHERMADIDKTTEQKLNALESLMQEIADTNDIQRGKETVEEDQADSSFDTPVAYPPMPPMSTMPPSFSPESSTQLMTNIQVEPQIIGGIGRAQGATAPANQSASKKKKSVYLPPSFMPAKLLTGIDAVTTESGMTNPETVVFRVQAPAILPNSLKANLKGCFVIGNAFGSLAKERVQVKLVSLACMALDGQAVIETDIKGFVADKDGKRGMAGNVVTKNGALVGRAFFAKFIGGIGASVASSSTTISTSPLGQTQVVDPDQAFKAGVGEGLKGGADQLEKVFIDYIKQVTPVIEVGTSKDVTVVIQEGVDLQIKETSNVL